MPDYIIAYHGGRNPASPEEGTAQMKQWQAWVGSVGTAAINPGTPLGPSRFVSADGIADNGSSEPMSGFSVVRADNLDAVLEMAGRCPHIDVGRMLEVAEMKSSGK